VAFVIASSLAFAAGGAFMKASDGFVRLWPSVMVALLFLLGAAMLTRAVRAGGLATAYTFGLGVEAILAVVVGMWWFDERLSPPKLIGITLIVIGVAGVRLG
jgi:small multidrug resistance pump